MAGRHRYRLSAALRSIRGRGRRAGRPSPPRQGAPLGSPTDRRGIARRVTADAFAQGQRAGDLYVALQGNGLLHGMQRLYCASDKKFYHK
jgi:hypothetical protein